MQNLAGTRDNSLLELIAAVKRSEAGCASPLWLGSYIEDAGLQHYNPVQHSKLLWHLLSLMLH